MTAYLTIVIAAVLSACSLRQMPFDEWAAFRTAAFAYPETRSSQVKVLALRQVPAPRSQAHTDGPLLPGFAHHTGVSPNARALLDGFHLLYQAPNRHPDVAEPYLPPTIPDHLMIIRDGKPLLDQELLPGFTGADGARALEAAGLRSNGAHYLLVVARASPRDPMWVGIFGARGEILYRAGMPHGAYHFTENKDGVSIVDEAGLGRRIVLQ